MWLLGHISASSPKKLTAKPLRAFHRLAIHVPGISPRYPSLVNRPGPNCHQLEAPDSGER